MSRATVWIVLGLLFLAHVTLNLFFSPIGAGDGGQSLAQRLFWLGVMGATTAPAVLLAIAAVIAPVPAIVRVPATMVLTATLSYATALGNVWNSPAAVTESAILPFLYAAFLVPALVVARLRRWRVVPGAPVGRLPLGQFSLYGLLTVVTMTALTLAVGRWIVSLGQWPDSVGNWGALAARMGIVSLIGTAGCLPVLACTAFVLAPARRWRLFVAWIVSVVGALTVLLSVLTRVLGPATAEDFARVACVFLGVYGSSLVSLLVVRWCGFRLVRGERGGAPGVEDTALADPPSSDSERRA